jgi:hypothetical protein
VEVVPPVGVPEIVVVEVVAAVVEVVVAVVVVVGGGGVVVSQPGVVNVSSSSVTAPLRASARPWTTVPVVTVTEVKAMIVPMKLECVPKVAELPTCQNTLQAWTPLIRLILLAEAVIKVEAAWKIKTASGFPWPLSVKVPLTAIGPDEV